MNKRLYYFILFVLLCLVPYSCKIDNIILQTICYIILMTTIGILIIGRSYTLGYLEGQKDYKERLIKEMFKEMNNENDSEEEVE